MDLLQEIIKKIGSDTRGGIIILVIEIMMLVKILNLNKLISQYKYNHIQVYIDII